MSETETFRRRGLRGAVFTDCAMAGARFDDVDLSAATFVNVALKGARFTDVSLAGAAIEKANIAGLTIEGRDVAELLAAAPTMVVEPQFFVSDLDAACRLYVGKLGFTLAFAHGAPPFYAQVARGGVRLNLRHVDGPVFDRDFRAREADALSATITLRSAEPLYEEFRRAGVAFHQPLRTEPWGARTFIVADPDGNLVAFAGRS